MFKKMLKPLEEFLQQQAACAACISSVKVKTVFGGEYYCCGWKLGEKLCIPNHITAEAEEALKRGKVIVSD